METIADISYTRKGTLQFHVGSVNDFPSSSLIALELCKVTTTSILVKNKSSAIESKAGVEANFFSGRNIFNYLIFLSLHNVQRQVKLVKNDVRSSSRYNNKFLT